MVFSVDGKVSKLLNINLYGDNVTQSDDFTGRFQEAVGGHTLCEGKRKPQYAYIVYYLEAKRVVLGREHVRA